MASFLPTPWNKVMNTNERQPQTGPAYSPRQMSQGNTGPTQQAQYKPAPEHKAYQAPELVEEDIREYSACLGED